MQLASDLSIAFLLLLERLGPEERAAFLLHKAFDRGYPEIAETLGKGEAACRQLVHRARLRVREDRKRFEASEAAKIRLLEAFSRALAATDERALLELLAPDVTWTADGGGRVPAGRKVVVGAERIVRLRLGLGRSFYRGEVAHQVVTVDGEAGLLVRPRDLDRGVAAGPTRSHGAPLVRLPGRPPQGGNPTANPRIDLTRYYATGLVRAMLALQREVEASGLPPSLIELVKIRASQMNGCAFCIDMHTRDARAQGETEPRIYALDAWRETPFFTDRERAALAWTEAVTNVADGHVPDEVYEEARRRFEEADLVALTFAVVAINGWNRLAIPFRTVPGSYEPKTLAAAPA